MAEGRAAAGVPYGGEVQAGHALRILTGGVMPSGTDTVVMDEDVDIHGQTIVFGSGLKQGANRRRAGEDVSAGYTLLRAGMRLGPAQLAHAAAVGLSAVAVHAPLRVAVLSTGSELVDPGAALAPGQIYDANRPMLLSLARAQGVAAFDAGRIPDDPGAIAGALREAAALVVTAYDASGKLVFQHPTLPTASHHLTELTFPAPGPYTLHLRPRLKSRQSPQHTLRIIVH